MVDRADMGGDLGGTGETVPQKFEVDIPDAFSYNVPSLIHQLVVSDLSSLPSIVATFGRP